VIKGYTPRDTHINISLFILFKTPQGKNEKEDLVQIS